ncbi:MAG: hypothetical protein KDA80_20190, partial [Planctomycetaceae bacterium]|nr:hypothetical protein [Planctomycetaceae bacterium]
MLRIVSVVLVLLLLPTLASAQVIADFNGQSYDGWTAEGNAFGNRPAQGTLSDQMAVTGYEGDGLVNSYFDRDGSTGTLTSPEFTISGNFLSFLIGGGDLWDQVGVELLINGERKHAATGKNSENLDWRSWDVRQLQGQRARLRIFDHATGSWGHILIDEIAFTETPLERPGLTRPDDYRKGPRYYREQYRPQFHFTPQFN